LPEMYEADVSPGLISGITTTPSTLICTGLGVPWVTNHGEVTR
jgi:hypothetical protein